MLKWWQTTIFTAPSGHILSAAMALYTWTHFLLTRLFFCIHTGTVRLAAWHREGRGSRAAPLGADSHWPHTQHNLLLETDVLTILPATSNGRQESPQGSSVTTGVKARTFLAGQMGMPPQWALLDPSRATPVGFQPGRAGACEMAKVPLPCLLNTS